MYCRRACSAAASACWICSGRAPASSFARTASAWLSLAAAAALVLLLGGGALQLHLSREAELQAEAAARRVAAERRAAAGEASAGFASILLEIQGLNEEGFFSHEETESLSL